MASPWDKLGQAASIMQVTGVDAFGLVSMILQAANTAHQNKVLCQQLAQHVLIVGDLLRRLEIPELMRYPETRRPLEQLNDALFRAYKLVRYCSQQQGNKSKLYQMFTGANVASKLRQVQEEIDRYISLIPMITVVAVVSIRRTNEAFDDLANDAPPATQRPRLSLHEVTESLALEEMPPRGEATRNGWHLMIENVRSSLFGQTGWDLGGTAPLPGLDADAIRALPVTLFRAPASAKDDSGQKQAGDDWEALCSICIVTLEAGEKVKVLPPCGHCFHPECVDLWLRSYHSCPLCRCLLLPAANATAKPEEVNGADEAV